MKTNNQPQQWNPWRSQPARATSAAELEATRSQIDLQLTDVIGELGEPAQPAPDDSFLDDLDSQSRYGCTVPRESTKADEPVTARRERVIGEFFPKILKSAEEFLDPGSNTVQFLRAAVSGNKDDMRECVRMLDAPIPV